MSKIKVDMNGYRNPCERERQAALEEMRRGGGVSGGSGGGAKAERQCGYRKEGGIYAEVPTSPSGKPLEHFIVCPPVPIDAQEYGLHPKGLGVKIIELPETCEACAGSGETIGERVPHAVRGTRYATGACSVCGGLGLEPVAHVFDIVGEGAYPNVTDYLEEARRLGISRRLELEGAEYARLTRRSRLFLLHKRAVLSNTSELIYRMGSLELERMNLAGCPKSHPQHRCQRHADGLIAPPPPHSPACAAFHWHVIEGGKIIPESGKPCDTCGGNGRKTTRYILEIDVLDVDGLCDDCGGDGIDQTQKDAGRFVERRLVSCTYRGYTLPDGFAPDYALGIFAIFPLVKLTVIDPKGEHTEKVAKARRSKLEVDVQEA